MLELLWNIRGNWKCYFLRLFEKNEYYLVRYNLVCKLITDEKIGIETLGPFIYLLLTIQNYNNNNKKLVLHTETENNKRKTENTRHAY